MIVSKVFSEWVDVRKLEIVAIGAQYLIFMLVSKMILESLLFFETAMTNVALI